MFTVIIACLVGLGAFAASFWPADLGTPWSVTLGVVGFLLVQIGSGLFFKKRVMREMERVQGILLDGQKRIQAKVQRWQFRPPGSVQAAQQEIFRDTCVFVREALAATEGLAKFRFWVPMIDRQMATAQLQLHWMIKEFKEVDRLMPKAILLDPNMAAIKMARMYMLDRPSAEIEKVYKKAVGRVRYNGNVLLAAAWSWMLVKRGDVDGAFKALTEALKKSDNATLKQNHETLMNNRVAHFSNTGIGDQWYSLMLEEPRMRAQRPHSVYR